MSIDIWCPPVIPCGSLTDKIIPDALWLLIQGGIWDGCVCQDRLVITWDIGRTLTWDPHHSGILADPSNIFTTLLHYYEFWAKASWLHTGLLLGEPIYSSTVEIYHKTGPRYSSHSVSRMVCIELGSQKKTWPSWLRQLWGEFLFFVDLTKLTGCPLLSLEYGCINHWVYGINY